MDRQIVDRANEVLATLDMWRMPVDPFKIAKEERIELAPGDYGPKFDARIEYLPLVKRFIIYYHDVGRSEGRIRFSLGHELGHYYLDDHKTRIVAGKSHTSISDFQSRDPKEKEADQFAAELLMPRALFVGDVKQFRNRVCTLREILMLAQRYGTSITSTALRYCKCDIETCAVILSFKGDVRWAAYSEDMDARNMKYIKHNAPLPRGSKSHDLCGRIATGDEVTEGCVETTTWFPYPKYRGRLWEEAMALGSGGFVLTYLTLEDPDK